MFRRKPQNRLEEDIIIKQRNEEKQAWAYLRMNTNSTSNYLLLDHFHNKHITKKSKWIFTCC